MVKISCKCGASSKTFENLNEGDILDYECEVCEVRLEQKTEEVKPEVAEVVEKVEVDRKRTAKEKRADDKAKKAKKARADARKAKAAKHA